MRQHGEDAYVIYVSTRREAYVTSAYVSTRLEAYVSIRQHTPRNIRQHTSAHAPSAVVCPFAWRVHLTFLFLVSSTTFTLWPAPAGNLESGGIRQHTSAYVSIRQHMSVYVSIRQHTSADCTCRQCGVGRLVQKSAHVSIRQHTSAYVSICQRTAPAGSVESGSKTAEYADVC